MASDRSLVASIVPEEIASLPGKRRKKSDPKLVKRASGRLQLVLPVRPDEYSAIHNMIVAPWVPVPGNPTILHAVRTITDQGGFVPESSVDSGCFSAVVDEGWVDFLRLDGILYSRLKRPIEGEPGEGKVVCRCCWFWTEPKEMDAVWVDGGGSPQRVPVCRSCIKEGAIARTTHRGYPCKPWENPRTD